MRHGLCSKYGVHECIPSVLPPFLYWMPFLTLLLSVRNNQKARQTGVGKLPLRMLMGLLQEVRKRTVVLTSSLGNPGRRQWIFNGWYVQNYDDRRTRAECDSALYLNCLNNYQWCVVWCLQLNFPAFHLSFYWIKGKQAQAFTRSDQFKWMILSENQKPQKHQAFFSCRHFLLGWLKEKTPST